MAEDLGEITIKFGDGDGDANRRPSGAGQPSQAHTRTVADAARAAMSGILTNIPLITRVAQAGVQGYGLGGVVGATRVAASGIAAAGLGAGAVLAPVLAIAAGVGVIGVSALAIRSAVGRITDRVSELAAVNGPMALQDAMTRISEMRRDMREARILGPMYTQVSQLVNKIKDLLQPFLMAFRAALMSIIIPILENIADYLQRLFNLIPGIAQYLSNLSSGLQSIGGVGGAFSILSKSLPGMPAGVSGLFGILSWLFPPSQTSGTASTLNNIANTLMQFFQSYKNQQQQGTNGWAVTTLNALVTGGVMTQPANLPAPIFVPVRSSSSRGRRPSGPTP